MRCGDVFHFGGREGTNPLWLVESVYSGDKRFQLVGIGASVNSNAFYHELHSLEEILAYLKDKRMRFVRNINNLIYKEVAKLPGDSGEFK